MPVSEHSEQLRAALAARLERVRGSMSDVDFAALVDDVIRTTQRFEEIDAREKGSNSVGGLPTYNQPQTRHPRARS
jgi:hypothetical protein